MAALQVALRAKRTYTGTVDGVRGPQTIDAVRRFQARRGLLVDGVAGPATRRALGRRGRPRLGRRVLQSGARGWDVAGLQFLLARHGFPSGPFDGGLGPRSAAALIRFQTWTGLPADGLAGPATLHRLRAAPPRSPLVFALPVVAPVGDGFGPRGGEFHPGLDFPVPGGTPIAAAGRGCVEFAGATTGGYGNLVIVRHRLGMTSYYAHLSRITVRPGACVVAGTRIGRAGSTGRSPARTCTSRRGCAAPPCPRGSERLRAGLRARGSGTDSEALRIREAAATVRECRGVHSCNVARGQDFPRLPRAGAQADVSCERCALPSTPPPPASSSSSTSPTPSPARARCWWRWRCRASTRPTGRRARAAAGPPRASSGWSRTTTAPARSPRWATAWTRAASASGCGSGSRSGSAPSAAPPSSWRCPRRRPCRCPTACRSTSAPGSGSPP